jgi:hypothetical protein
METQTPLLVAQQANRRTLDAGLLAAAVVVLFGGILLDLAFDAQGGWFVTAGLLALTFAVIFLVVPRRLEVWPDRLVIVFTPWRWRLPFETVAGARQANTWSAFGYWGVRLSTAPAASIEVRRVESSLLSRPNLIISPEGRDEFVSALQQAMSDFKARA